MSGLFPSLFSFLSRPNSLLFHRCSRILLRFLIFFGQVILLILQVIEFILHKFASFFVTDVKFDRWLRATIFTLDTSEFYTSLRWGLVRL